MKHGRVFYPILILCLTIFSFSCRKKCAEPPPSSPPGNNPPPPNPPPPNPPPPNPPPPAAPDTIIPVEWDDALMIANAIEELIGDVFSVIETDSVFSLTPSTSPNAVCDAAVIRGYTWNPYRVFMNFNGNSCNRETIREGTVVIYRNDLLWGTQGETINFEFNGLKLRRVRDNKLLEISFGLLFLQNITGDLVKDLNNTSSGITHRISTNDLNVVMPDGSIRFWNISQSRVYRYNDGLNTQITSDHVQAGEPRVIIWGTDRSDKVFLLSVRASLTKPAACRNKINGGEMLFRADTYDVKAVFGLDSTGNSAFCPPKNFYYQMNWKDKNSDSTRIHLIPY